MEDLIQKLDALGEKLVDCDGDEYRDVNESDIQEFRKALEEQRDEIMRLRAYDERKAKEQNDE